MFRAVLPRLVRPARFLCSVEGRQPVKVCIVGSGPAAYTAAIYASRALLKPIVFEGFMAGGIAAGGQLTTTTEVENYPGFPAGIGGPELMAQMREQALRCGAHILTETVVKVNVGSRPFEVHGEDGTALSAESLIIATGATAKRMNLPGEETYWQRGVSACAVCDGALPLFRNQELLVVGGGDSACEEATYLSKYGSRVRMLVRRGELRASKVMRTRAEQNPKVEIVYNTIPTEVLGDGKKLTSVMVQDTRTGERRELPAAGLFYAIGHQPNTAFLEKQLNTDESGYIITSPGTSLTSVAGVFACGDVQDHRYRQAITAAGSGCMAALDAEHFLAGGGAH